MTAAEAVAAATMTTMTTRSTTAASLFLATALDPEDASCRVSRGEKKRASGTSVEGRLACRVRGGGRRRQRVAAQHQRLKKRKDLCTHWAFLDTKVSPRQ